MTRYFMECVLAGEARCYVDGELVEFDYEEWEICSFSSKEMLAIFLVRIWPRLKKGTVVSSAWEE